MSSLGIESAEKVSVSSRTGVSAHSWRDSTGALLLSISVVVVLFAYSPTVGSIVRKWWDSGTFSHGFLVLPICGYLFWTLRNRWKHLAFQPFWGALPLLVLFSAGWIMANLASVKVVQEFTLVAAIDVLILMIAGVKFARRNWFALAYLLFTVPMGDSLIPSLQSITAAFAVWGVQLTGVPVLQQGYYIYLPSGTWEVAAACSGLRYLISSIAIGVLFAYLTFRSTRRRLLFVAASVIVPILANSLRAFGILMLAHLSNRKLAVGVDHIIYGWIFFGIVTAILFAIGFRFRDGNGPGEEEWTPPVSETIEPLHHRAVMAATALGLIIMCASPLWARHIWHSNEQYAALKLAAPVVRPEWVQRTAPPTWEPHFRDVDQTYQGGFSQNGKSVDMLVLYYSQSTPGSELIQFDNEMVDGKSWTRGGERSRAVTVDGKPIVVRELVVNGLSTNRIVWYWYWVGGQYTANRYSAKLQQAQSRALGKNPAGALIALSIDSETANPAAVLQDFLDHAAISQTFPGAR
jgi:exosortase A